MSYKGKIEIYQTSATTCKFLLNGQDISDIVSSYKIERKGNDIARVTIELLAGAPFTEIKADEEGTCEIKVRGKSETEVMALDFSEDIDKFTDVNTSLDISFYPKLGFHKQMYFKYFKFS